MRVRVSKTFEEWKYKNFIEHNNYEYYFQLEKKIDEHYAEIIRLQNANLNAGYVSKGSHTRLSRY